MLVIKKSSEGDKAKKSVVVALDVSTKVTGVCILVQGKLTAFTVKPIDKFEDFRDYAVMAEDIMAEVLIRVPRVEAISFFVEEPFIAMSNATKGLLMTHGALISEIMRRQKHASEPWDWSLQWVGVSKWRSWFLNHPKKLTSKQLKAAVMQKVRALYEVNSADDNDADAIGLMSWVMNDQGLRGSFKR